MPGQRSSKETWQRRLGINDTVSNLTGTEIESMTLRSNNDVFKPLCLHQLKVHRFGAEGLGGHSLPLRNCLLQVLLPININPARSDFYSTASRSFLTSSNLTMYLNFKYSDKIIQTVSMMKFLNKTNIKIKCNTRYHPETFPKFSVCVKNSAMMVDIVSSKTSHLDRLQFWLPI